MPARLVHLIRHGESAGNLDPTLPRGEDPPLTALGRTQALRAAGAVARLGIEALFSSPIRRARQTAEPIAAATGLPVTLVAEFGEVNMGSLSNSEDPAARAERDAIFSQWLAGDRRRSFPDGEDFPAITRRVVAGLALATASHRAVAVVTHRMAIAAAVALCTAASAPSPAGPCANGSITTLRHDGQRWALVCFGDARHLA